MAAVLYRAGCSRAGGHRKTIRRNSNNNNFVTVVNVMILYAHYTGASHSFVHISIAAVCLAAVDVNARCVDIVRVRRISLQ